MNKSKKHKTKHKKDKSAPSSAPSVVGYQLEDANTIMPHMLPFKQPWCTDQGSAVFLGLVQNNTGMQYFTTDLGSALELGRSHLHNPKTAN